MPNAIAMFVHVEKTAGVTALRGFEASIGKQHIFIYSPKTGRLARDSDNLVPLTAPVLELIRSAMSTPIIGAALAKLWTGSDRIYQRILKWRYPALEIHEDARLITGHFVGDQFDSLLCNRNPIRGIMVREPLDRMISQYNYWFRDRGGDDWRVLVPFRSGLDFQQYFREFAMLEELQNHQTKALGGLKIYQFDVVGVTEHTSEFIKAFLERLSQEGLTLHLQESNLQLQKRLNVNVNKLRIKKVDLDEEFIQAFKVYHAQDYALYRDAVELSHRYVLNKPTNNM